MPEPKTTLTYEHSDVLDLVKRDAAARGLTVIGVLVTADEGQMGRGPTTVRVAVSCELRAARNSSPCGSSLGAQIAAVESPTFDLDGR